MTNKNKRKHNIIHNTKSVISSNDSLNNKILRIINSNPRQQYNVKTIDQILEGKLNYYPDEGRIAKIRTELNRLANRSKIKRMKRGYFQAKTTLEIIAQIEDPLTRLHGLKIEIKKILGISAQYNIFDWCKEKRFMPISNDKGTYLKRWKKQVFWKGRTATITIHECGLIEIFLNASDRPLSYEEFCGFCEYLDGFFEPFVFTRNNAYVTQLGMGKDFEELHLDGLTCIRLHKFKNDWCSIYQKDDGRVRFEHHTNLDINLEDAINIMSLISTPPKYFHSNNQDEYKDVT